MELWDYYFGAICSIRFHPKNQVDDINEEIRRSADIADQMIKERDKRWQSQQH